MTQVKSLRKAKPLVWSDHKLTCDLHFNQANKSNAAASCLD